MFEQQPLSRSSTIPPPQWTADAVILDWIDAWQYVRSDILKLTEAFKEADVGHDISNFALLIDEVDAGLGLLKQRVNWLRDYLGRPS